MCPWKNTHPTEEVRFVTFNYDTLLEHACRQSLQLDMRSVDSYVAARVGYKVFKPHGSVNWVRTLGDEMGVKADNPEPSIIALGHRVELAPGFHLMADPSQPRLEGHYVFRALALPVNTKLTSSAHPNTSHNCSLTFLSSRSCWLLGGARRSRTSWSSGNSPGMGTCQNGFRRSSLWRGTRRTRTPCTGT